MKSKGLQTRLLYPARLSIKMLGQIRSFPDKRNLKEHTSTKPEGPRYAKGTALRKGKKKRMRERGTQVQRG